MALLGSSVDPRLFLQDYSGFTRAAEIQAQGMQNLGASIGGAIESYAEAKEKRKKIDAATKASRVGIESAIKLGEAYGIDVKSSLEPILAKMDDPNTTPMEAAMYGEEAKNRITNVLNMGITASERESAQQRAMMEQQYKAAQLGLQAEKVDIARQQAAKGPAPKFEIRRPTITSPTGEVFEGPELPYDESRGMYFDPKVRKYIADPNLIGTGKEYAPDSAMPTPTSQVMPSDGKFGFTYKTRDLLPASMPNARQISLDFNAAANKNAKGIEIIIPNNASDIERALALDYVNKTKDFFASKGVDVPVRGVRTAAENKRGSANRFHTEPFFVNDAASRAAIESDPDGYAKVLASTIGKIPGAMFIPPHKSNDPGASANGINERDFAKSVLIPALERLSNQSSTAAIGTPQQQAEVARMIEQGAGMATAQNIPQGAIPTEPSMATQQPQLPQQTAPQWTPPPGFAPVREKGKKVDIVTGPTAQALNLDPRGTYEVSREDGNIIGVQTIKAAPTISETLALEKKEEEKVAKQQMAAATAEKSARMIELMTGLKNSPGFENLFGANWYPKGMRGTAGADAAALFKQIEALGFMEAIKDMKGMGALSDAEGQKASAAFLGINPDMSEEAAKKKIDEVIGYITKGQERLQSGKLIPIQTTQPTSPSISGANSYFNQYQNQPPAR